MFSIFFWVLIINTEEICQLLTPQSYGKAFKHSAQTTVDQAHHSYGTKTYFTNNSLSIYILNPGMTLNIACICYKDSKKNK